MSTNEAISQSPAESAGIKPKVRAAGARTVSLALEHGRGRIRNTAEDIYLRRFLRAKSYDAKLIVDDQSITKALLLEQQVWREEEYEDESYEEYSIYIPQSRVFAIIDGDKCIAMNRLFSGVPELPPFIKKMKIDDEEYKQRLIEGCKSAKVEEFGTVAVGREFRNGRAFLDLCRIAWRDSSERGIEAWGIIMEPERVEQMNRLLGFTFSQVGPAVDYQGGECAAHVMDFDEVRHHMLSTKSDLYHWFVNEPL